MREETIERPRLLVRLRERPGDDEPRAGVEGHGSGSRTWRACGVRSARPASSSAPPDTARRHARGLRSGGQDLSGAEDRSCSGWARASARVPRRPGFVRIAQGLQATNAEPSAAEAFLEQAVLDLCPHDEVQLLEDLWRVRRTARPIRCPCS